VALAIMVGCIIPLDVASVSTAGNTPDPKTVTIAGTIPSLAENRIMKPVACAPGWKILRAAAPIPLLHACLKKALIPSR
jgi:hypothetical protein